MCINPKQGKFRVVSGFSVNIFAKLQSRVQGSIQSFRSLGNCNSIIHWRSVMDEYTDIPAGYNAQDKWLNSALWKGYFLSWSRVEGGSSSWSIHDSVLGGRREMNPVIWIFHLTLVLT